MKPSQFSKVSIVCCGVCDMNVDYILKIQSCSASTALIVIKKHSNVLCGNLECEVMLLADISIAKISWFD